jgi:photosystem II stability/assembly factor-like uncharacterized protein
MSPMTDTEERLTTTLRYVADLPPGNVEVAPNARPRTAGPSRYALVPRRWLVFVGAVVVSVCLLVAGLVIAGLPGQGTAPGWELISTLNPAWEAVPGSLSLQVGFSLTCTGATTCFASGPNQAVYITRDTGHIWHQVALPGQPISGVQCASPNNCSVLTFRESAPPKSDWSWFMSETSDGGRTWSSTRAPSAINVAVLMPSLATGVPSRFGWASVSCATMASCVIVAESVRSPVPSAALFTTDAGRTWAVANLPHRFVPSQIQCFARGQCLSTGFDSTTQTIAVAFSANGGSTWSAARVPDLSGAILSVSCSSLSYCMAVPISFTAAPTTSSVLVSTDGGHSWSLQAGPALPAGGTLWKLSCPVRANCWAMGDNWPVQVAFGGGPDGAFAAATTDTRGPWRSATLPPAVQGTEAVSCPSIGTCFALAWTTTLVLLEYRT